MFTGLIPYYNLKKDPQVISNILRDVRPRRPMQATSLGLSDEVWSLIVAGWEANWQDRPSMTVIIERLQEALTQRERTGGSDAPEQWPLTIE